MITQRICARVSECTRINEYLLIKNLEFALNVRAFPLLFVYHENNSPSFMLSYFVTQVDEDMWNIMRRRFARRFRSDFIFPKTRPHLWSLSRVINNGLSFVGFNAAATPHKAKLSTPPGTSSPPPFMPLRKGVAREKTSLETCTRNCFGVSLNQIPRFFRVEEHLRAFRREIKLRSQYKLSPQFNQSLQSTSLVIIEKTFLTNPLQPPYNF